MKVFASSRASLEQMRVLRRRRHRRFTCCSHPLAWGWSHFFGMAHPPFSHTHTQQQRRSSPVYVGPSHDQDMETFPCVLRIGSSVSPARIPIKSALYAVERTFFRRTFIIFMPHMSIPYRLFAAGA